jgi:MFS family permease
MVAFRHDRAVALRASARAQYAAAAAVLFLTLLGSQLATPLYSIWQERFGLSTAAITIIYACYGAGVTVGLVFGGRLGDQLGRKPMIVAGVMLTAAASIVYLFAASAAHLVAARLINGVAIGIISGPILAAIVELQPSSDRVAASRVGAIVTLASPAAGLLLATSIARLARKSDIILALPFLVQLCGLVVALILASMIRETIQPEDLRDWRRVSISPRPLVLPPDIRSGFVFASIAGALSWANTGLWLSLGPMLASEISGSTDKLYGGLTIVGFLAIAGMIQLVARRLPYRRAIAIALSLMPVSLFLICATLIVKSMSGLVAGAILAGAAQGLGWMGCSELANRIAPADIRASVLSWLYVSAYAGTIAPVVLTGIAADAFGLPRALLLLSSALSVLATVLFIRNNAFARLERSLPATSIRLVPGR